MSGTGTTGHSGPATNLPAAGAKCLGCGATLGDKVQVRLTDSCLIACAVCASWNYFPRPDEAGQIALHDDDDYFETPYFTNRRQQIKRAEARCRKLFAAMHATGQAPEASGARTLDIGCGGGELLDAARRLFGVDPVGLDVAQAAARQVEQKKIDAVRGSVTDLPREPVFDYIFAIDVIEHVSDPQAFVQAIADRLRPGGMAYIETPNHLSVVYGVGRLLANLTGGRPRDALARLYPPHHIVYLSANALQVSIKQSRLELRRFYTRRLPMLDVGGAWPLRFGLGALQILDTVTGEKALTCMLLSKVD